MLLKHYKKVILMGCGICYCNLFFAQTKMDWVSKVGAKSFPAAQKVFNVNKFGVKANDTTVMATNAIQKAIDECSKSGGGIVSFDAGMYKTGSIFLKIMCI